MTTDSIDQAREFLDAGDFEACRQQAMRALAERPGDVETLRLLGKANLELGDDAAADYFRQIVDKVPDDASAWRDLGGALLMQGDLAGAADTFRQVVRLLPDDAGALIDLGHVSYAMGDADEGIRLLSKATALHDDNVLALRSLLEMYRRAGRAEDALRVGGQILKLQQDDLLATMDSAELNRALGDLEASSRAYARLRRMDTEEQHETYALHGMIEIEMERAAWRRALDLAIEATGVDRFTLTTDLLAFIAAQLFGPGDRPIPSRAELDASLAAERAEHRRLHMESPQMTAGTG